MKKKFAFFLLLLAGCGPYFLSFHAKATPTKAYIVLGQSNATNWLQTLPNYRLHGSFVVHDPYGLFHGEDVVIIPSIRDATTISGWDINADPYGLYSQIIMLVKQLPRHVPLTGLIVYQGEGDAYRVDKALAWGDGFSALTNHLRKDLARPGLPVVYARISGGEKDPALRAFSIVRDQQLTLNLADVKMISTDDLEHDSACPVHLTTKGYALLGPRFFGAFTDRVAIAEKKTSRVAIR